jgi:hypothetical protein
MWLVQDPRRIPLICNADSEEAGDADDETSQKKNEGKKVNVLTLHAMTIMLTPNFAFLFRNTIGIPRKSTSDADHERPKKQKQKKKTGKKVNVCSRSMPGMP